MHLASYRSRSPEAMDSSPKDKMGLPGGEMYSKSEVLLFDHQPLATVTVGIFVLFLLWGGQGEKSLNLSVEGGLTFARGIRSYILL